MMGRRGSPVRLLGTLISGMVVGVTLFSAWSAQAAEPVKRFSIMGSAGAGRLALGDVNNRISDGNRYLHSQNWKTLGSLHLGFNFGYALRLRVSGPITLGLGGSHVLGRSEVDFKQVISVKPTADFYDFHLMYALPFQPKPSIKLAVGAGPVYTSNAKLAVKHDVRQDDNVGYDRSVTATFQGKGWGARAFLQAETVLNSKVGLVADLGYRWASISRTPKDDSWKITGIRNPLEDTDGDGIVNQYDLNPGGEGGDDRDYITESFLEVTKAPNGGPALDGNGRPITAPRGGDMGLDFSGVQVNVGLRFYLF